MKTHYQAPWIDNSNVSVCNDTLINPNTSTTIDSVDCKRCIKVTDSYTRRNIPVKRKGNGIAYSFRVLLNNIKWIMGR